MKDPDMGMDVYGRQPTTEKGKYFRNNIWWWRPLADMCLVMAPDICAPCTHWQSNDGDGLDADGAKALADVLEQRLKDGTVARYIAERDAYLEALPDEACQLCNGSGVRRDKLAEEAGMLKRVINEPGHPRDGQVGWCNSCDGVGHKRPFETHYPADVENVEEFVGFLKDCGGFDIH